VISSFLLSDLVITHIGWYIVLGHSLGFGWGRGEGVLLGFFGYHTACELDSMTHMASVGWAEIGRFIQLGLIGPAWFHFFRHRKLGKHNYLPHGSESFSVQHICIGLKAASLWIDFQSLHYF
jgi:hypothetical protein